MMNADDSPPKPEQLHRITEGSATIVHEAEDSSVFYNPVQVANRDLSVAVLSVYAEMLAEEKGLDSAQLRILEALSATGLRSIRYWKELAPHVQHVVANDLDAAAVSHIRRNVEYNGLSAEQITPSQGDAALLMYRHGLDDSLERFDVIDIDPYGTCAPFLDASVRAVEHGGILAITSTDMIVLCGNTPEVCFSNYGASPSRGKHCHEHALRIVLGALDRAAIRHKRYIEPLIAMQMDFYVRAFVRVRDSASNVKESYTKSSYVYKCVDCSSLWSQPVGEARGKQRYRPARVVAPPGCICPMCGGPLEVSGPVWNSSLYNGEFLSRVQSHMSKRDPQYAAARKLQGLLSVLGSEAPAMLFHHLPTMCKTLRISNPPRHLVMSAILNMGYSVSNSHTEAQAIKTDCPVNVLWDILKCWEKKHPVTKRAIKPTPGMRILAKPPSIEADFTPHPDAPKKKQGGGPRFVINPPRWGPGTRGKINKRPKESSPAHDADSTKKHKSS